MTAAPPPPLPPAQVRAAVDALRTGLKPHEVADRLGLSVRSLYWAARQHDRLALALAGRDPDAHGARGDIARADYVRLLALGCSPTLAAHILTDGTNQPQRWRQVSPGFAEVCDAAETALVKRTGARGPRFTPDRVIAFLEGLREGRSVVVAAAEIGITTAAVYQRRRRDEVFRRGMDRAVQEAAAHAPAPSPAQQKWEEFMRHLLDGKNLRGAAMGAGLTPETVYRRRYRDEEFRRETDAAQRGTRARRP